jgi:NADH-quinone oxidoreductase subunit J
MLASLAPALDAIRFHAQAAAVLVAKTNPSGERLAHGSAWAVFVIGAGLILAGALGVILLRNPVHCALFLVITLFGVALEFIDESASFLAVVQIIVYAGAIVILFLFVIMYLGVDRKERIGKEPFKGQKPIALILGVVTFFLIFSLARVTDWTTGARSVAGKANGTGAQNVQVLGQTIYTRYLLPFEMTSALLVIAIVSAVVLARRPHRSAGEMSKAEQEEVTSR